MESGKSGVLIYGDDAQAFRLPLSGYRVMAVFHPAEAKSLLESRNISLILARGDAGLAFLKQNPAALIPKILLTHGVPPDDVKKSIHDRLVDLYITDPADEAAVEIALAQAGELFRLRQENLRLSMELNGLRDRVNQIVEEKTSELVLSVRRLEEANQLKDKLFAIISHDLMTPIFSFRIFLEVITRLKDDLPPERFRNYGVKVQTYVQSVTELLENLLNWSLSHSGTLVIQKKAVLMNRIIENNCRIFKLIAEHKNIRIQIAEFPDRLKVMADENILNIVIRNLISNAIKFTPELGKVFIRSEIREKDAVITVEDSGVGIRPELIRQLFNNPTLYSSRGVRNEKGVGLGLKICKEFIEKLNGRIWVESVAGRGSVFSVSLPLAW